MYLKSSNILFFLYRIFFEPETFFCKPGELPTKENGGVALLKGKKVRRRKRIFSGKGNNIITASYRSVVTPVE